MIFREWIHRKHSSPLGAPNSRGLPHKPEVAIEVAKLELPSHLSHWLCHVVVCPLEVELGPRRLPLPTHAW